MIFPTVNSRFFTGVVMSNSRLPRSRSRMTAADVNSTIVIVRMPPHQSGHDIDSRATLGIVIIADFE